MLTDPNLKQEIRRFFEGANQGLDILRPVVVELDRHLAKRFNFFHSIKFDENPISDVFAYLLNPDETHGQGDLFLREFLADVKDLSDTNIDWWPISSWSYVYVAREMKTTRIEKECKIDIVIAFDRGGAAVAIENKSRGAQDLPQQLCNYARHLESIYEKHFKLIYLTSDGKKDPSEVSITPEKRKDLEEEGQFVKASIQKWADGWLKRAEDEVKAERVRWFVSDFRRALKSLPA